MALHGHYVIWLVALSYAIAASGSFIALHLAPPWAGRLSVEEPARVRGVLPSGVTLGLTIWAMHFAGMSAFNLEGAHVGYELPATLLSLVVAVVFTAIGFSALALLHEPREAIVVASIPMASGILSMHFLGMMAMTRVRMHFDPGLVVLSAAIALLASMAALWMSTLEDHLLRRIGSALIMAVGICGMHYTGMAAAHFAPDAGRQIHRGFDPDLSSGAPAGIDSKEEVP